MPLDRNAPTGTVQVLGRAGGSGPERRLVVPPGGEHATGPVGEALPRADPPDAPVERARLRHVLQRQVVRQPRLVDAVVAGLRGGREGQQRLLLAGQVEPVRRGQVEHRLDAVGVPGTEDQPLLGVDDDEGEHPAQPLDHRLAPMVEAGDDDLAVPLGVEPRTVLPDQLLAQLDVVVDLAIEDQLVPAVGVGQRLVAALHVDDRQALVADDGVPPDDLHPGLVRPPVVQALQRLGDGLLVCLRLAARADEGQDPAHGEHPSAHPHTPEPR